MAVCSRQLVVEGNKKGTPCWYALLLYWFKSLVVVDLN